MPMHLDYLPCEFVELNVETTHHHALLQQMHEVAATNGNYFDRELQLAVIAAYCGVIVDGYYSAEDQLKLASHLTDKLRLMRRNEIE